MWINTPFALSLALHRGLVYLKSASDAQILSRFVDISPVAHVRIQLLVSFFLCRVVFSVLVNIRFNYNLI